MYENATFDALIRSNDRVHALCIWRYPFVFQFVYIVFLCWRKNLECSRWARSSGVWGGLFFSLSLSLSLDLVSLWLWVGQFVCVCGLSDRYPLDRRQFLVRLNWTCAPHFGFAFDIRVSHSRKTQSAANNNASNKELVRRPTVQWVAYLCLALRLGAHRPPVAPVRICDKYRGTLYRQLTNRQFADQLCSLFECRSSGKCCVVYDFPPRCCEQKFNALCASVFFVALCRSVGSVVFRDMRRINTIHCSTTWFIYRRTHDWGQSSRTNCNALAEPRVEWIRRGRTDSASHTRTAERSAFECW